MQPTVGWMGMDMNKDGGDKDTDRCVAYTEQDDKHTGREKQRKREQDREKNSNRCLRILFSHTLTLVMQNLR